MRRDKMPRRQTESHQRAPEIKPPEPPHQGTIPSDMFPQPESRLIRHVRPLPPSSPPPNRRYTSIKASFWENAVFEERAKYDAKSNSCADTVRSDNGCPRSVSDSLPSPVRGTVRVPARPRYSRFGCLFLTRANMDALHHMLIAKPLISRIPTEVRDN